MEKLDFILALYSSISNRDGSPDLSTLTQDAVNFYRKSIQPIHSCLSNHFGNDKDLFLEKYPKLPYSEFGQKCTSPGRNTSQCIPKK
jgi:hypothetical protein